MIRYNYRAALVVVGLCSLVLASCGKGSHAADDSHGEHGDEHAQADAGDGHGDDGHGDNHGKGHEQAPAKGHDKGHGKSSSHGAALPGGEESELVEIDLGEFTVTQRQAESNTMLLIRFQIFGVVEREKKEAFDKLLEDRRQRMRDSVITIVQKADVEQLSDPSLGSLKAKILPAVNKLLRTRLLKDVVFSDYSMLQG